MASNIFTSTVTYILSFELFLGGQARLTPLLTPTLYKRAMSKADGTRKYLSFIPITDPIRHSNFIGGLMILAGALLLGQSTRVIGSVLSGSLSLAGVYSQNKMGIPYWLPCVNAVLAAIILLNKSEVV